MISQTPEQISAARNKALELLALIQERQPKTEAELIWCLTVVELMASALIINVRPASLHDQFADELGKRVKHWLDAVKKQFPEGRRQ
jgi:hypothetical protein